MNWKYVFNPFLKFSEKQMFLLSLVGLLGFRFFGSVFESPLISIFKIANVEEVSILSSIFYAALSYGSAIVMLVILGRFFNSKTRVVDIVNTVGISQLPLLFVMFIYNIPFFKNFNERISNSIDFSTRPHLEIGDIFTLSIFLVLVLPFLIYSIALIYNGFKTATNIKTWQNISVFAGVLILFLIIYQLTILNLNL